MRPGWVAGSVRARALTRRRLGREGARSLAATQSVPDAVATLSQSPYGHDVHAQMDLRTAARAVRATVAWDLRVLAGWLRPAGVEVVRSFAGLYEIDNIEGHAARLSGAVDQPERPVDLGALALAWPRVSLSRTGDDLRHALATSAWRDPEVVEANELSVWLRLVWARRLADSVPGALGWAAGACAAVVARQRFVHGRPLRAAAGREALRLLGRAQEDASDVADFARCLPPSAAWILSGIDDAEALWDVEARWWRHVDDEAAVMLLRPAGKETVGAACARLMADAWRVRAALEAVAWGGPSREQFDAVA